jgi:hypothetical protein
VTLRERFGNPYAGTGRAALLATVLTMAAPLLWLLTSGYAFPPGLLLAALLICVGLPAWFGIHFLMIPVEQLTRSFTRSAWLGGLAAVLANCALVALIGRLLPTYSVSQPPFDYPRYLAFAVYAAIVWLTCEHLLKRTMHRG